MSIASFIKNQYEETLENRYNDFKAFLEDETFVPDATEVWKMYEKAFSENNGIYAFAVGLLDIELYDQNGRINELHIILDRTNRKYSDYCSAYVTGMQKKKQE